MFNYNSRKYTVLTPSVSVENVLNILFPFIYFSQRHTNHFHIYMFNFPRYYVIIFLLRFCLNIKKLEAFYKMFFPKFISSQALNKFEKNLFQLLLLP